MRVWRRARVDPDPGRNEAPPPVPTGQWPLPTPAQPQAELQYYMPWKPPGAEGSAPFDTSTLPQSATPVAQPEPAPETVAQPEPAPAPVAQPETAPASLQTTPASTPNGGIEMQTEFLRVLEVVTRMCDHVIEYIEADRQERKIMVETLGQLARVIATNVDAVESAATHHVPIPTVGGEQIIGGSMERGPDPVVDLRQPEPMPDTRVEVRCSFGEGERWVDGFEIIDVTDGDDGPMYRLRRQRDGAILPQLFEAASIRHVETFQELSGERTTWTKL